MEKAKEARPDYRAAREAFLTAAAQCDNAAKANVLAYSRTHRNNAIEAAYRALRVIDASPDDLKAVEPLIDVLRDMVALVAERATRLPDSPGARLVNKATTVLQRLGY